MLDQKGDPELDELFLTADEVLTRFINIKGES